MSLQDLVEFVYFNETSMYWQLFKVSTQLATVSLYNIKWPLLFVEEVSITKQSKWLHKIQ